MSDLISRQNAIDAVRKVWYDNDDQNDFKQRYYEMGNNDAVEDAIGYIDALPSADAVEGWIPVSERLPENSGRYIVTLKDIWAITVRVAVYGVMPQDTHNKKVFWIYDSCYDDLDITEDVVAWMPLPDPYKGGDDE